MSAVPTAWLLAAAAAGAVCEAAYCAQKFWSAAKASNDLPGPGATGMVGPGGGDDAGRQSGHERQGTDGARIDTFHVHVLFDNRKAILLRLPCC